MDPSPSGVERPPSVDALARSLSDSGLPHPLLVSVAREAIAADDVEGAPTRARARARRMLMPVINATGVLLHTNLGRAPLAHHQDDGYLNLELDLATGKRGSRQAAVGEQVAAAVGAEAALIVNNCAAAVMLALAALAGDAGVAVSRSELVEIGGGFRVPDVMAQSGARLVEVGTTNRTRLADFQRAIDNDDVGLALHVHQSNYKIVGFTESVSIAEMATLGVPVLADIGSGLLDAACPWLDGPPPAWLADEPAVRQTLDAGADLVMFSGDKLMGGPQAGIIVGDAELVARCAKHPLARALRPGGLVLNSLQTTIGHYLRRDGDSIPFWRAATTSLPYLKRRAEAMAEAIPGAKAIDTEAVPGGGTLPTVSFPSAGIRVQGDHLDTLRNNDQPIVGRVEDGSTVLDLRTVDPDDDATIIATLTQ